MDSRSAQGRSSQGSGSHRRSRGGAPPIQVNQPSSNGEQYRQVLWGTDINIDEIQTKFRNFILNFVGEDSDEPNYMIQIRDMEQTGIMTLNVDCDDLFQFDRSFYQQLIYYPSEIIPIMDQTITDLVREIMSDSDEIMDRLAMEGIQVKTINLRNITSIRELNANSIDNLVALRGIVMRCSDIIPEMQRASFRCVQCGHSEEILLDRGRLEEPNICDRCYTKFSFTLEHNQSFFNNKQHIKLQEQLDKVPEGELPKTIQICVYDDLVDTVNPGTTVEITGIYKAQGKRESRNRRTQSSVFMTYLDAVSIAKLDKGKLSHEDDVDKQVSEEVKEKMNSLGQDPDIYEKLIKSFAPNVWEYNDIKKGLLCQLFGGVKKDFTKQGRGNFRDNINILLVGDPSTSKSQLLKYVNNLSSRGIYTSGKGSSVVGLTVYVKRDYETKEIILESGALVLSDKGICCIDEFDKMDQSTRGILHEVMEQQTISVAKAGIICQLNSRTAILAAANPIKSKYDPQLSVVENIELGPTLLSRFDLIYLMLDRTNEANDRKLAMHVLSMYGTQEFADQPSGALSRQELADYINYARKFCKPTIKSDAVKRALVNSYLELRGTQNTGQARQKVIQGTPRQLESIIRLSESLAKMRLSEEVLEKDVNEALRLIKVATQQAATDPQTGRIDIDLIQTGLTATSRAKIQKLVAFMKQVLKEHHEQTRNGLRASVLVEELRKKLQILGEQATDNECFEVFKVLEDERLITRTGSRKNPIIRSIRVD